MEVLCTLLEEISFIFSSSSLLSPFHFHLSFKLLVLVFSRSRENHKQQNQQKTTVDPQRSRLSGSASRHGNNHTRGVVGDWTGVLIGGGGVSLTCASEMVPDVSSGEVGDGGGGEGLSADNVKGLMLALSSSVFIGASFIVKKKGLKKAGASGTRAGAGGYSYLNEPLWWAGMITMIFGEIANFVAYAFAPAILVTPLGALSIIISAALAHIILRERLHIFGILGCILCVVGSITIVLHAPQERQIESVKQVWDLAKEPGFVFYAAIVMVAVFTLIFHYVPHYGQTHVMVYIGVCSLIGSLSVMSVKALSIALKLTFSGTNQLIYPQTWAFTIIVISCIVTQLNYLNKALDTFNAAVVSPIYYVMFTSLTILASVIMFKDWDGQNPTQIVTEMCGFVTILSGTFLLHKTKDMADDSVHFQKYADEDDSESEGIPLRCPETL